MSSPTMSVPRINAELATIHRLLGEHARKSGGAASLARKGLRPDFAAAYEAEERRLLEAASLVFKALEKVYL